MVPTLSLPPLILKLDRSLFDSLNESRGSAFDTAKLRFDLIEASCSDISLRNASGSVFNLLLSILLAPLFAVSSPSDAIFGKRLLDDVEPGES